jgi:serine/threonine-protein kinase
LQHPGIVPVYELGEFPGGRSYFTMKLVKGQTLAALLDKRSAPGNEMPRFLKIFEQVCQTVAYAHSRRVIHRDLKPLNVMVGAFGEVQVMDWGLAKVMGKAAESAAMPPPAMPGVTDIRTDSRAGPGLASQHGWGTPEYMPPEQARGEADQLDARCDVFALGAILCKILTGQPPYVGPGGEALRLQALMADLTGAFARLDACGAEPDLVQLARHCLAAKREDRPADASAVAAAMTAYLGGVQERLKEAEVARAAALVRAAEERKRRRLTLVLGVALLGLLVAGGSGWWWAQTIQDAHAAQEAQRAADAERDVRVALNEAASLREQAHKLQNRPSDWQAALASARSALKRAEALLAATADDELRQEVAQLTVDLDEDTKDRLMVKRLEHIRLHRGGITILDLSGFVTADAELAAAFREYGLDLDRLETAEALERIQRRQIKDELAEAIATWLQNRVMLGKFNEDLTQRLGRLNGALSPVYNGWFSALNGVLLGKNLRAARALVDHIVRDPQFATLSGQRVNTLAAACWMAEAGGLAELLLSKFQQARPEDFWANWNLGSYFRELAAPSNPGEAARYLAIAQALRPDVAEAREMLGAALAAGGEFKKAIAVLESVSPARPTYAQVLVLKGNCWLELSEPRRAAEHFQQAIAGKPDYPEAHAGLGAARSAVGRDDEAVTHYREALQHSDGFEATVSRRQLVTFFKNIAGADPKANQFMQNTLQHFLARVFEEAPGPGECYLSLGEACFALKRLDDAVDALEKAVELTPKSQLAVHWLSFAYRGRGELDKADRACQRWLKLDTADGNVPTANEAFPEYIRQLRLMLELDRKLPAILHGKEKPSDEVKQLAALAALCKIRNSPVAAALYYERHLALKPEDTQSIWYDLCRVHLSAAAGRGGDAQGLSAEECAIHRVKACGSLYEQSAARSKRLLAAKARDDAARAAGGDRDRESARVFVTTEQELRRLKRDPDLAVVREPAALAKLPAEEQHRMREFWAAIDRELAQIQLLARTE